MWRPKLRNINTSGFEKGMMAVRGIRDMEQSP
jgi:hypothetical protein